MDGFLYLNQMNSFPPPPFFAGILHIRLVPSLLARYISLTELRSLRFGCFCSVILFSSNISFCYLALLGPAHTHDHRELSFYIRSFHCM